MDQELLSAKTIFKLGTHKDNYNVEIFQCGKQAETQFFYFSKNPQDVKYLPKSLADIKWCSSVKFFGKGENGLIIEDVKPEDVHFRDLPVPAIRVDLLGMLDEVTQIRVFAFKTSDKTTQLLLHPPAIKEKKAADGQKS